MTVWYVHVRNLFWCFWVFSAVWSVSQWRTPKSLEALEDAQSEPALPRQPAPIDSLLTSLAVLLDRMPFDTAELLETLGAAEPMQAPVTQPNIDTTTLMLRGIAKGEVPYAIIEGLPGTDRARAMRVGETVADVRLIAVDRDSAVVAFRGANTTVFLKRTLWIRK